ncbi:hypothetical protein ROE7235_02890 [Roseibaca ekhonensis]|jgi:quinol monooxygenase YgiN|uniref:ABM domain-containing protein n=1 Tax=Roseinatronobacter ekhonensis TaxID=254356 RepID=A0A3B0MB96_9RHOB|nr:antibiotic biosynthesis monooxygenase [Roseibaca ekhonensis]SUZ33122.1 hypothetical protein ROE7235_02890 [Roseibaca ekhonensis]
MSGVTLTGTLTCATTGEAALVRRLLPAHIAASRAEPGCLRFDVTPRACGRVWDVSEEFTCADAFDAHQRRTQASLWGSATAHITRAFTRSEGPAG